MLLLTLPIPSSSSQPISSLQDTVASTSMEMLLHPAPQAQVRPAAEGLTCRRSSLKTSVFSALQDKKEHKALVKGPAHDCMLQHQALLRVFFHWDAASEIRFSGPTSHHLIL